MLWVYRYVLGSSSLNCVCMFFFVKQKTAYEMRISDWSSDVCSSDLLGRHRHQCQYLEPLIPHPDLALVSMATKLQRAAQPKRLLWMTTIISRSWKSTDRKSDV